MSHIHTVIEDGKPVQYLRLDVVKERERKLLAALKNARSDIEDYAPHASEYLQQRYCLAESLAEYDAIIAEY